MGLFDCICGPRGGANGVLPLEPSTPPGLDSSGRELLGHDHISGGKQPLAERKQQLGDSPAIGPGLLSSTETSLSPASGHAGGSYPHSRSRQRRQSMEATEALNTTLEMARQRRLSSNCYEQTSTSGQSQKGFMNWGWLKGSGKQSKRLVPGNQVAAEPVPSNRLRAAGRDGSINTAEL